MRVTRANVLWAATLGCVVLASAAFTIAYLNSEDDADKASECATLSRRRLQACLARVAAERVRQEAESPGLDARTYFVAGTVLAVAALILFALTLKHHDSPAT
jgi:hypothetical protein